MEQTLADIDVKKNNLLESTSIDKLDSLLAAVEATHKINAGLSRVNPVHKSSNSLLAYNAFKGSSNKFHRIIDECIKIYLTTGIIRNIINLMVDFASEDLIITHNIPSQHRFYRRWARAVKFNGVLRDIFFSLILTGQCFVLRHETELTQEERVNLTTAGLSVAPAIYNTIPSKYSILNPMRISTSSSALFGEHIVTFSLSQSDISAIKNPITDKQRKIVSSMIKIFGKSGLKEAVKNREVILDTDRLTTLHYNKIPWQSWAYPLIFSAIDDINFKKMLRRMDESAAADAIRAVVIFRLGKLEDDIDPGSARFTKLANLLLSPTPIKNIAWDNLIDVVDSFPPIDKILGEEKYKEVDRDILSNFGVSEVLVSGTAQQFSSGFLSVRTLQEKLQAIRTNVKENFVEKEINVVQKAMGYKTTPHIKFTSMSLKDETTEKKLVKELFDRQILSVESTLDMFGYDINVESDRIKEENKQKLFKKQGPFLNSKPAAAPNGRPDQPAPLRQKTNPQNQQAPSDSPQNKKRSTKPTGASLSYSDFLKLGIADTLGTDLTKQHVDVLVAALMTGTDKQFVSFEEIKEVLDRL